VRQDGLAGVLVAAHDYPLRVAFSLIAKTMTDYEAKVGNKWKGKRSLQLPTFSDHRRYTPSANSTLHSLSFVFAQM
jgi:hypothetical protein